MDINIRDLVQQDFELKDYRTYSKGVVHDSLVIDHSKNMFYWNSLGISGGPVEWLTEIKGLTYAEALIYLGKFVDKKKDAPEHLKVLPESPIYQKLLEVFYETGKTHRDYWYSRGYSDETIDHFKLGYTGNCYVIPIIFQGILYNFQCRTPDKKIRSWTRGLGVLPFNFDVLSQNQNVIITESPVNAVAMYQYGYDAVAPNNGASSWQRWWTVYFNHVHNIIVAYDNDDPGYKGAEKVTKIFRDRAKILVWPEETPISYDLNDLLKENRPKPEIVSLLVNSTFNFEQYKLCRYMCG